MAEVNKEIEEMLNAMGDPTPENLKDEGEEESPETPETPNVPEESETPENPDDAETPEVPETPEIPNDGEEEEVDKDKIIENLRSRINEKVDVKITEEKVVTEKKEEKKEEPLKFEEQDFIGDLDLDDLTRDKTAFNKILNSVYAKGVNDSKRIATEGVLNSIPDIVKHNLTLLTNLKEMSDNFYNENKDLVPFKRVVAAVFEEVAAQNPDKKYNELMNLVGPEARKRLELHKQATKNDKAENDDENKPPRLHSTRSGQRQQTTKPNTSALEKEISEMNKSLGIGR